MSNSRARLRLDQFANRDECSTRPEISIFASLFRSRNHAFPVQKTAFLGFLIGVALGCLFVDAMGFAPNGNDDRAFDALSVNPNTGKPQLHIKGKPEIQ